MDGMATPNPNNSAEPRKNAGGSVSSAEMRSKESKFGFNSLMGKHTGGNMNNDHGHKPTWASKTLVFLLIIASLLVITSLSFSLITKSKQIALTNPDQYQAVFLNNGQVYFGKLSSLDDEYVVLRDIYYLQIDQAPQPDRTGQNAENPNVSLVKLGNELHGPEDEMFIVRDKIVFWENLKNDNSQVVKAINDFRSGKTNQNNNNNNQ